MLFQPLTTGYLITTVENVLITGKRTPPLWLSFLTVLATVIVLIGGILVLLLLKDSTGHQDVIENFLGVVALLLTVMFPANMVIRYYLRLENPLTIQRSSILDVKRDGAVLTVLATIKGGSRPHRFVFNTRGAEEAANIEHNLAVHAHGRLRCYPITFLPSRPQFTFLSFS